MPIFIFLPEGWHAATFPTIMSGEVVRFYWGANRDDAVEVVNVSRDGVGLASHSVVFSGAVSLDDLRRVLDVAEQYADRLVGRGMARGRWAGREGQ
jgi:hypothetical protein